MSSSAVDFDRRAPEVPDAPGVDFRRRPPIRGESLSRSPSSRGHSLEDGRDSPLHQKGFKHKIVKPITIQGVSAIEIRSAYLLDAIERVNKHPPLQPIIDCFTEQEPYPTLFYHMDDVEREIAQINNKYAAEDLEILHSCIDYMHPIWNKAREKKLPDNMNLVSYDMMWKYFRPGDLVLRKDDIGNLWLFVLVQATYYQSKSRYKHDKEEKKAIFDTWSLTWDEVEGCLVKKYATFTCAEFSGQRHIKSLPVYPIRYEKEIQGEDVAKFLAERGRKWWDLIATPSTCQDHCGLAYIHMHISGEKFRVCFTGLIIQ